MTMDGIDFMKREHTCNACVCVHIVTLQCWHVKSTLLKLQLLKWVRIHEPKDACYLDDFGQQLHALQNYMALQLTAFEPRSNALGWWQPLPAPAIQLQNDPAPKMQENNHNRAAVCETKEGTTTVLGWRSGCISTKQPLGVLHDYLEHQTWGEARQRAKAF